MTGTFESLSALGPAIKPGREPFATNQTSRHALADDALEHHAKHIALAKTTMTDDCKCRVAWNLVFEAQTTEPLISKVVLLARGRSIRRQQIPNPMSGSG